MRKKCCKLLSLLLAVIMLVSVVPLETIEVNAAVSAPSNASALSKRMENIVSGSYGVGKYFTTNGSACSGHNRCKTPTASEAGVAGAKQCFGYARYVFYQLFGHSLSTSYYDSKRYVLYDTSNITQIGQTKSSTAAITKNILSQAYMGDIIQASKTTSSGQHTMVVYDVSSSGITVLECNRDNKCGIAKNTFTWSAFSSKYPYFTLYRSKNHPGMYEESTKFSTPLRAYTLATGKTTVYSSINGAAKTNKIYDTDYCTINAIYENGWCKVTFPLDAGGTETGYVKTAVFLNPDYNTFNVTASKKLTIYTRSDLSKKIENISANTKLQVVGHTSKAVQILYKRTSGDYGIGWVPISVFTYTICYNANGGSGTMTSTTTKYAGTLSLTANKFTKTGYTFTGWNVYRTSDKTWYVKGVGWNTSSQISANKYTKSVYKNKMSCVFNKSWVKDSKTNDTLTFYPIWQANTLSVYFNANGATIKSDTYKLSGNLVYNKNGEKTVQKWTYNEKKKNGLPNVSTFGLSKTGYSFKGWGTSASGGTLFDQNDTEVVPTSINANIKTGNCTRTLYAIWKPNTYAVKYNANGGTGAPSSQTKIYGTNLTLSNNIPIRNSYIFKGWSTSSTASTAQYQPGASYTTNKAVTLYAVWKLDDSISTHTHEWETDYIVDIEPTCTEEGIKSVHCKSCSVTTKITILPTIEHTLEEIIIKEANCSTVGQKAMSCSICGTITKYTEIPTEDHNFVSTVVRETTCTQEGMKEDICSECQLHTNSQTIPVDEHAYGEWIVVTEASANGDGLEERRCSNCQQAETRTIHYIPVYDDNSSMIAIQNVQADAGDQVKVSIDLLNNPGFCTLKVAFIYDANYLTLTSIENKVPSMVMTSDTEVTWNTEDDYLLDGQLATLTFAVSENSPGGDFEIQVVFIEASNSNSHKINMQGVSGIISVPFVMFGDANVDKTVDAKDALAILKHAAKIEFIPDGLALTLSDANHDSIINAEDALEALKIAAKIREPEIYALPQ